MNRTNTRVVKIGNISLGGDNNVLIQSMCDIKTSNFTQVIEEINECAHLGASLMRISILDDDDIKAIKKIKNGTSIPLVADIHYDLNYAIKAINEGIDAIRINPGNTQKNETLDQVIELAKKKNIAIRIGLNEGSLKGLENKNNHQKALSIVRKTINYVKYFESKEFYNLVLSVKSSSPLVTLESYRRLAKKTDYPLHIGVTESGFDEIGIIRSTSCLAPLLLEGIGSTIRISLTKDPKKEVISAKRLLHDVGLYENYPTIISCPTCGRTTVTNIKEIAQKTLNYLEENNINIKVAVMGCVVNGVGEGKHADVGIAGNNAKFIIFSKGKVLKKVDENDALIELFKEIDKYKNRD